MKEKRKKKKNEKNIGVWGWWMAGGREFAHRLRKRYDSPDRQRRGGGESGVTCVLTSFAT